MARLLANPRSKVLFAGWESDTLRLGQQGWDISIQENIEYSKFEALLHHKGANLILHAEAHDNPMKEHHARRNMIAMDVRNSMYNSDHRGWLDGPIFNVVRAFAFQSNLKVFHSMPVFDTWSATRPAMVEMDMQHYNPFEFPIFMRRNEPMAKELIVEPQDVMALLEQIKQMQSPEQADIRRRNRQQVPMAHATILSFGEAA